MINPKIIVAMVAGSTFCLMCLCCGCLGLVGSLAPNQNVPAVQSADDEPVVSDTPSNAATVAVDDDSLARNKLAAFRELVRKYQTDPGPTASEPAQARYANEVRAAQEKFLEIELYPAEHPRETKAILELFSRQIEGRYRGGTYQDLETAMGRMHLDITIGDPKQGIVRRLVEKADFSVIVLLEGNSEVEGELLRRIEGRWDKSHVAGRFQEDRRLEELLLGSSHGPSKSRLSSLRPERSNSRVFRR